MNKFWWLKIFNSPFKRPVIRFYFGEVKQGTPYFLPRKWVKFSEKDMQAQSDKMNKKSQEFVDRGLGKTARKYSPEEFSGYQKAVPKKFGYDIVSLGWKTRFGSVRHEWNPMISVNGFGKQFCIFFGYKDTLENMCCWESFIHYEKYTDKNLSLEERLLLTMKDAPCSWETEYKGYTNYYTKILRDKYLKFIDGA